MKSDGSRPEHRPSVRNTARIYLPRAGFRAINSSMISAISSAEGLGVTTIQAA